MLSFRVEGLAELAAAWRAGVAELVRDVQQSAAHAAQVATRDIKAAAPVRSGDLKDSIEPRMRTTARGATGEIVIGAEHASFVKDGTPPHTISAKNARFLRFEVGGRTVFAKSVKHPGTKPNDFVSGGVEAGQSTIERDAMRACEKLKAKIEG